MRDYSIAQRPKNHYEPCLKLHVLYLAAENHGHPLFLNGMLIKLLEGCMAQRSSSGTWRLPRYLLLVSAVTPVVESPWLSGGTHTCMSHGSGLSYCGLFPTAPWVVYLCSLEHLHVLVCPP